MPILSRQLRGLDDELARSVPFAANNHVLDGDGAVVKAVLSVRPSPLAVNEPATGRLFVKTRLTVIATALQPGMVVDVFDLRRGAGGAMQGECGGVVVLLPEMQDTCVHGADARVVGRVRARLLAQNTWDGSWNASVQGFGLGPQCCWN